LVFHEDMDYFWPMNRLENRWLAAASAAALLLSALPARCDTAPRSYDSITTRNAFRLKDPPPPPAPPVEPEKPGDLKLTGISSMFATKKAHFMLLERGKGAPKFYSLPIAGTGGIDEQDGLRVLEIDPKAGSVKVRFHEKEILLTFEKDGLTNAIAPAIMAGGVGGVPRVPGAPGQPGGANPAVPGGAFPQPGTPGYPSATRPSDGLRSIPTRTMRTAVEPQPGSVAGLSLALYPGQPGVAQVWNNPNVSGNPRDASKAQANQPPPPPLTAEEAVIRMEIERELHRAEIEAGKFPPLPPTPLTVDATQSGTPPNLPPGFPVPPGRP
jgi:hypothetical protein